MLRPRPVVCRGLPLQARVVPLRHLPDLQEGAEDVLDVQVLLRRALDDATPGNGTWGLAEGGAEEVVEQVFEAGAVVTE